MQNHFKSIGENYKVEIINDIPESEELSFYKQDTFLDCVEASRSKYKISSFL